MNERDFIDSNIFIYLFDKTDARDHGLLHHSPKFNGRPDHEAFPVHTLAHTGLVHQVDADLLENAGADPAKRVVCRLALQDHVVDAGLVQQLTEQQPRRAGADDGDLGFV